MHRYIAFYINTKLEIIGINRISSGAPKLNGVNKEYISQAPLKYHRGKSCEMFDVKKTSVQMSMPRLLREFPLDFECPTPEELLPVSSNFESKKGVVAFCICYLIQLE